MGISEKLKIVLSFLETTVIAHGTKIVLKFYILLR